MLGSPPWSPDHAFCLDFWDARIHRRSYPNLAVRPSYVSLSSHSRTHYRPCFKIFKLWYQQEHRRYLRKSSVSYRLILLHIQDLKYAYIFYFGRPLAVRLFLDHHLFPLLLGWGVRRLRVGSVFLYRIHPRHPAPSTGFLSLLILLILLSMLRQIMTFYNPFPFSFSSNEILRMKMMTLVKSAHPWILILQMILHLLVQLTFSFPICSSTFQKELDKL